MLTLAVIVIFILFGAFAVAVVTALCHAPLRDWLLEPFLRWTGLDERRRPKG